MNKAYKSTSEIVSHLLKTVSSDNFLRKEGLGNEIPFFICPYKVGSSVEIEQSLQILEEKLKSQCNVAVLSINLYDLSIDILKERNLWERIITTEKEYPKQKLKELFQNVLDVSTHIIPRIDKLMKSVDFDVLFLSGIGEVYPYMRSHNVLSNLQSTAKEKPTVLFFPGEYTHSMTGGASLNLFSRLSDDKYYRAFNIFDYEAKG